MRTVYLGTSPFAAAVLERLAASAHRPSLVVTRPDRPKGRGRSLQAPPVADAARALGLELIQPEDLHAPDVLARIAAEEPGALVVCAYGVLVKEPLLSDHEIVNVHPSLLPRWRGAAPLERAIMAGDAETGVSIMRLTAGLDSGPVCLAEATPIGPDDDYGTLAARLQELAGRLLVRALDERPPWVEQDAAGVTYAHKIEAADRALDPTRRPETAERTVRALRPHIGARIPLPDGSFLGVVAAAVDGPTLAPAGGRVRTDGERLLLDCRGGALELTEIRPPGGRPMAAGDWLRGRPDPALTDFWLDPTLPGLSVEELVGRARAEWAGAEEWAPGLAALGWRGTPEVLDALRGLADDPDPVARSVAAYVAGQLGAPLRSQPAASAALLEGMAAVEADPAVLAVVAEALGQLGAPWGLDVLLGLRGHPHAAVRDGVVDALAGRADPAAVAALVELSRDTEPAIRDWATFALGTLTDQDSPELRDALVARLDDGDAEARIEAVHGLALRADPRAVEPALALLADAERGATVWSRHALLEATILLGGAERRRTVRTAPAAARRRLARDDAGARPHARARALRGRLSATARARRAPERRRAPGPGREPQRGREPERAPEPRRAPERPGRGSAAAGAASPEPEGRPEPERGPQQRARDRRPGPDWRAPGCRRRARGWRAPGCRRRGAGFAGAGLSSARGRVGGGRVVVGAGAGFAGAGLSGRGRRVRRSRVVGRGRRVRGSRVVGRGRRVRGSRVVRSRRRVRGRGLRAVVAARGARIAAVVVAAIVVGVRHTAGVGRAVVVAARALRVVRVAVAGRVGRDRRERARVARVGAGRDLVGVGGAVAVAVDSLSERERIGAELDLQLVGDAVLVGVQLRLVGRGARVGRVRPGLHLDPVADAVAVRVDIESFAP